MQKWLHYYFTGGVDALSTIISGGKQSPSTYLHIHHPLG